MIEQAADGGVLFTRAATAIIRQTYHLREHVPTLANPHNIRYNPRTVQIEVATRADGPLLGVVIDGRAVIATRTGLMETSQPVRVSYTEHGGPGCLTFADLPDWVTPLITDARTRAREAWA